LSSRSRGRPSRRKLTPEMYAERSNLELGSPCGLRYSLPELITSSTPSGNSQLAPFLYIGGGRENTPALAYLQSTVDSPSDVTSPSDVRNPMAEM